MQVHSRHLSTRGERIPSPKRVLIFCLLFPKFRYQYYCVDKALDNESICYKRSSNSSNKQFTPKIHNTTSVLLPNSTRVTHIVSSFTSIPRFLPEVQQSALHKSFSYAFEFIRQLVQPLLPFLVCFKLGERGCQCHHHSSCLCLDKYKPKAPLQTRQRRRRGRKRKGNEFFGGGLFHVFLDGFAHGRFGGVLQQNLWRLVHKEIFQFVKACLGGLVNGGHDVFERPRWSAEGRIPQQVQVFELRFLLERVVKQLVTNQELIVLAAVLTGIGCQCHLRLDKYWFPAEDCGCSSVVDNQLVRRSEQDQGERKTYQ